MPKQPVSRDNRHKALDTTVSNLTKRYGEGAVMLLGAAAQHVAVIPTGSLALDMALGVGSVPRGRITEIYGPESSGKTTICQHIIAQAQRRGGICAYIDAEHALDPIYAARCGVDLNNPVSYTHLRAHETVLDLVCRLLLEKKKIAHTRLTAQYTSHD